jgi:2-dehydro-3-deoxyglucarate aldolase
LNYTSLTLQDLKMQSHLNKTKKTKLFGSWINTCSPIVAELMANIGFDFLTIDVEHSAADVPQVQQIIQGIRAANTGCLPFVRTQGVEFSFVKRYLDAGAMGIIAPLVNTRSQAEELVRAVRYPPLGDRGVGFCPANQFGKNVKEVFENANNYIYAIAQIEHADAVENIDEILSVKGIDGIFIGPFDLSASMGITGQFKHPDFIAARERILDACRLVGLPAGIHIVEPNPDELDARYSEGFEILAYGLDLTLISHAASKGVSRWNKIN